MKKLLVLFFVGLVVISCVEVKRPGLQMSATIDTRSIKKATDPKSEYMSYCTDLVKENKEAFIQCGDEVTYMPSGGKEVGDLMHTGIWENENARTISVKIMREGSDAELMSFTVQKGGFYRFRLFPGRYIARVSFVEGGGSTIKTFEVNPFRKDAWSKMANESVDFLRYTPAS